MDELLDIYDEALRHLGTKSRREVHRDGDWHRVFHCWVIYRDAAGSDKIIAQRRGPDKDISPNQFDISSAGHYLAGESSRDGLRELQEELGIEARFEELIPLGRRIHVARYGDLIDREFCDEFFLINDLPLESYAYQQEEIAGLLCFDIAEALEMAAGRHESIHAQAVGWQTGKVEIRPADFVPHVDAYLYKVLILAKRCLSGEAHLVI